jgi:CheY-like chemotaxis protein
VENFIKRGQIRMNPTVLVVEDDVVVADVLQMTLELEGYQVITAQRGEIALAIIEQDPPDLMTLDLRLPDMDGHYLLEVLHGFGSPSPIPVVVLSGGHYRACATDGVVAVLPKPFAMADLHQVLREALGTRSIEPSQGMELAA